MIESDNPRQYNGPARADIVTEARSWIGTPYQHQQSMKGEGTDCLGLVRGVWRCFYGEEPQALPPYSPDWAGGENSQQLQKAAEKYLVPIKSKHPQPAQIVLFRMVINGPAKHMGIITDEQRFVHAYAGRQVSESWLSRWWLARIVGLYDFPGLGESEVEQ